MRDSNTNRYALSDVPAELDSVVRKDADRNSFHSPSEHRRENAPGEIWLDADGRIGVCCHDCRHGSELRQRLIGPVDDPSGREVGEGVRWATT